jgi:GntR family transcriptional regulator
VANLSLRPVSVSRPLEKNSFVPLYYQIQILLMEKIHSGELHDGDLLASEGELASAYQVSRTTARQALHGLKVRGYAQGQRGRGTFITMQRISEDE